jgi:hypothetical protein
VSRLDESLCSSLRTRRCCTQPATTSQLWHRVMHRGPHRCSGELLRGSLCELVVIMSVVVAGLATEYGAEHWTPNDVGRRAVQQLGQATAVGLCRRPATGDMLTYCVVHCPHGIAAISLAGVGSAARRHAVVDVVPRCRRVAGRMRW